MSSETEPAELEELLAHAGWVRRVATCLVRDAGAADDLAQDVWLRALEQRPTELANPRGWLGAVARTLAITGGRGASRRRAREHAAARPESLPAADEVVIEAEREREVAELVLTLDEPYRSVVLLRFYRDLAPRHIAAELGRPVATVKVQLQRGLEQLRAKLDRRHGSREAWCGLLLPLCVPRASLALATLVQVLFVVGFGALALWWQWPDTSVLVPPLAIAAQEERASTATATELTPTTTPDTERSAGSVTTAPSAVALAGPRALDELHGRLVTLEGEPLVRAHVAARDPRQLRWAEGAGDALVAENFWLPLAPGERDELLHSSELRAAFLAEHVPSGGPNAFEAGTLLAGGTLPCAEAWSDARGCFALDVKPGSRRIELIDSDFASIGWSVPREVFADESTLYLVCASARLEGRVLDAYGNPCVDARVRFSSGCPPEANPWMALGHGLNCPESETRTDAEGRFVLASVPRTALGWLSAELDGRDTGERLDLRGETPPAPVTLVLDLLPAPERTRVLGHVYRPDGTPAREATVLLAGVSARTDDEGAFELVPSSWIERSDLVVFEPGYDPLVVTGFGAGRAGPGLVQAGVLRLPPTRLVLAGQVFDATGQPLAGAMLELLDATSVDGLEESLEEAASGLGSPSTDASGHFELGGLLDRDYQVRVAGRKEFGPFRAGTRELRLVAGP